MAPSSSGPWKRTTAVFLAATLVCATTFAQTTVQLTPSLDVTQIYDSNLLFAPADRQEDLVTRVAPGIAYISQSPLLTMSGRYSFDAERFAEHPDLSAINGHHGLVDLHYRPTRLFTIATDAAFTRTQMPSDLNAVIGFALRRANAERLLIHTLATRAFSRNTTVRADYSLTKDRFAGNINGDAQRAAFRVEHRGSDRDTTTVAYEAQRFDFHAPAKNAMTAHVWTAGWTHDISTQTSFTLRGGPRLSDGRLAPEIAAALHEHLRAADVGVEYTQTQTMLIGIASVADVQSIAASAEWKPSQPLQFRVTPGAFRIAREGLHAYGYRMGFEALRSMTRSVALVAAYDVNVQQGNIYLAATRFGAISRHLLSIGIVGTKRPVVTERY